CLTLPAALRNFFGEKTKSVLMGLRILIPGVQAREQLVIARQIADDVVTHALLRRFKPGPRTHQLRIVRYSSAAVVWNDVIHPTRAPLEVSRFQFSLCIDRRQITERLLSRDCSRQQRLRFWRLMVVMSLRQKTIQDLERNCACPVIT